MSVNRRIPTNQLILNAVINKEPVSDAFKNFRKTYRTRKIDYVDFEWKYYQFYHGNRDLTIERSPQNSSPFTFSDLQLHILELVVKPLVLTERLILRKVSRGIRNLVDSSEGSCDNLELSYKIAFDDFEISYRGTRKGCFIDSRRGEKSESRRTSQHHRNAFMTDASAILKNPRLKIDSLRICSTSAELLTTAGFRREVRSFNIDAGEDNICPILECVKPGCLESLNIGDCSLTLDLLNQLAETEQWRRATRFECYYTSNGLPMENMQHFKEIKIKYFEFTDENVIIVRDILLESSNLESCYLGCRSRTDEQTLDRLLEQSPSYNSHTRRFSISNSRHYFQMEYGRYINGTLRSLTITKVLNN